MFSKILIANRGEIACRIIKTCKHLGIQTVAVFSDADAKAQHVLQADEAIHIGPAPAAQSYLVAEKILTAAKNAGAEAIHPGYGFLSENADFARACEKAGIVFIGPKPATIDAMGSKSAAKDMMAAAGVPVVPGYQGSAQSVDLFKKEAARIGYPVLLKASAGGGGKGMRLVERESDLEAAYDSAKREAKAAFDDDQFLIEKFITNPRHVEVQVFGDRNGNLVHLFERDCSVQRRHQKVIEEAPAPNLPKDVRAKLHEAALQAAKAVDYLGAGTVEFLYDGKSQVYFMEMNTRLQVEHPVTEEITGQDLVEWQLRVAAGEALPLTQENITESGHAFEARIYAEDVEGGYLPSVGTLTRLTLPRNARIDTGISEGDEISPFYDPMILKLITHGATRETALHKMNRALAALQINGLKTNTALLSRISAHSPFQQGDVTTAYLETHATKLTSEIEPDLSAYAAAAIVLRGERREAGFRLNLPRGEHFWFEGETSLCLHLKDVSSDKDSFEITVGKEQGVVSNIAKHGDTLSFILDQKRQAFTGVATDRKVTLWQEGERIDFVRHSPLVSQSDGEATGNLMAPMPGVITSVQVSPGDTVRKGTTLLVMEAMKMEYAIKAPSDGTVVALPFDTGTTVKEGALLVDFQSA